MLVRAIRDFGGQQVCRFQRFTKGNGTVEANVGTAPLLVNSQIETRYIHAARRRAQ